MNIPFIVGETVTVIDGPFNSFSGVIEEINEEKKKLKDIADNALILIDKKNELSGERNVQEVASLLLKDTGIKTAIIKE